jgi:glycosyltransferase involved in cell wall biosynthesis
MYAEVAVRSGPFDLKTELESAGIPVHVLPHRGKWSLPLAARDLAQLCKERKADILHAHLYFPTLTVALSRWLKLWRGVTAATFHNLAYGGANHESMRLNIKRLLGRFLIPRSIDLPQCVSQAVADHYTAAYGLEKISKVYNPIDLELIKGISGERGDAVVLPGRLVHEKGHHDLISAIALMPKPHPPVIFVGGGPMREALEVDARESGVEIKFLGVMPHERALQTVATAGVVVIPSRFEGFGLAALEALALGCPVIATNVGGLPEVLGDVGSIVPAGDVQALSRSLQMALADEEWRSNQFELGPRRAANFSLNVIAEHQIELYKAAMREKK